LKLDSRKISSISHLPDYATVDQVASTCKEVGLLGNVRWQDPRSGGRFLCGSILHLNEGHFIVVTSTTDRTITYCDPGCDDCELTAAKNMIRDLWSGFSIETQGEIRDEEQ